MIKLGGLVDLKPLHEAEGDKYTHIGYGKYKEKGKEDDKNAPTFKKDGEKFVPTKGDMAAKGGDSSAGKDVPKVNIFDKPKEEPKSDKSSEPDYDKYNNKSQTMTDFFKGDLSIDDLQKVAKKNFDSEIATERDLDGFLNNKFMQDVMADEHGVDKDTLISKVKDLKSALFGGDKEQPSKEEPKSEPSQSKRQGNPKVNKATLKLSKESGMTPDKFESKKEYQDAMIGAAVAALTDANFHSEARELVAKVLGRPELAQKPDYPSLKDPDFDQKMAKIKDFYSAGDKYTKPSDEAEDFGIKVAQEAGWSGDDALDGIAFTLRMNGFHKLADTMQSVIKENKSTRLKDLK